MSEAPAAWAAPQISFIALVRDDDPWLDESITSVLSQRGCLLELILVDGGASERAWEWCMDHARSDARVRCLRPESATDAELWRVGRGSAAGEFVLFFSLQDLMAPDSLAVLYAAAVRESGQCAVGRQLVSTVQGTTSADISWKHVPSHQATGASNLTVHPGLLGVRGSRGALIDTATAEALDVVPGERHLDSAGAVTVSLLLSLRRLVAENSITWVQRPRGNTSWSDRAAEVLRWENESADLLLEAGSDELWRNFWRGSVDGHLRPILADLMAKAPGSVMSPPLRHELGTYLLRRDEREWLRLQPRLRVGYSLLAEGDHELVSVVWKLWDDRGAEFSSEQLKRNARLVNRLIHSHFADDLAVSRYYAELVVRAAAKNQLDDAAVSELSNILRYARSSQRLSAELADPSPRELALHQALMSNDPDLLNPPSQLPDVLICLGAVEADGVITLIIEVPETVAPASRIRLSTRESSDAPSIQGSATSSEEQGLWMLHCAAQELQVDLDYCVTVPVRGFKAEGWAELRLLRGAEHQILTEDGTLVVGAEAAANRLILRRRELSRTEKFSSWVRRLSVRG